MRYIQTRRYEELVKDFKEYDNTIYKDFALVASFDTYHCITHEAATIYVDDFQFKQTGKYSTQLVEAFLQMQKLLKTHYEAVNFEIYLVQKNS